MGELSAWVVPELPLYKYPNFLGSKASVILSAPLLPTRAFAFQIISKFPSSACFSPCNHATDAGPGMLTCSLRSNLEHSIPSLSPSEVRWLQIQNHSIDEDKGPCPKLCFSLLVLMGLCSGQTPPPSSHLLKDSVGAAGDLWDKRCCSQDDLDSKELFLCHCLSALSVKQTQPLRSGWTLPNIL